MLEKLVSQLVSLAQDTHQFVTHPIAGQFQISLFEIFRAQGTVAGPGASYEITLKTSDWVSYELVSILREGNQLGNEFFQPNQASLILFPNGRQKS